MFRVALKFAALVIALQIFPFQASAEQLGSEQCRALETRKAALVKAGAAKNMAKGAEWAQKNLAKPALDEIRQLIEVSEQLLFRCGETKMQYVDMRSRPVPRSQLEQAGPDRDDDEDEAEEEAEPKKKVPLPVRNTAANSAEAAKDAKPKNKQQLAKKAGNATQARETEKE